MSKLIQDLASTENMVAPELPLADDPGERAAESARWLALELDRMGVADASLAVARGVAWTLVDLLASTHPTTGR
jgi:hypothetical protein